MRVSYLDVLGVVCSLHHVKLNTLRSETIGEIEFVAEMESAA